ncbi:hypothetical protein RP20_CCG002112 [Aedes albopictus]|nr:hypothetical protein RP20_CCG002112 [Aedes albopictus]
MGSKASKEESSKTIGDQTVTIVENQEVYTSFLEDHAWKLNVILCLLTIQTLWIIIKNITQLVKRAMANATRKAILAQSEA